MVRLFFLILIFFSLVTVSFAQSGMYSKEGFFFNYPHLTAEDYELYKEAKLAAPEKETEDIIRALFVQEISPLEGSANDKEERMEADSKLETKKKTKERRAYIKRKKDHSDNPFLNPEEKGTLKKKNKLKDRSYNYKRVKIKPRTIAETNVINRGERYGPKRVDEENPTTSPSKKRNNTKILGK